MAAALYACPARNEATLADECVNAINWTLEGQAAEAPSQEFILRAALRYATQRAVLYRLHREEVEALRYAGAAEELARRYEALTGRKFDWHTILPK